MTTVVDAMGKPCPIPVVEAKKAIAALPAEGGTVLVKVDNEIACQNLDKLAGSAGAGYACEKHGDSAYSVTLTVKERAADAAAREEPTGRGPVVVVAADRMGDGSEELGRILIKGFLYAVGELDPLPEAVLFYNSGAQLAAEGSGSLADLKAMEEKGVRILICGTCADYYGIKDKIAVGEITNMYGIVTAMAQAGSVIRP